MLSVSNQATVHTVVCCLCGTMGMSLIRTEPMGSSVTGNFPQIIFVEIASSSRSLFLYQCYRILSGDHERKLHLNYRSREWFRLEGTLRIIPFQLFSIHCICIYMYNELINEKYMETNPCILMDKNQLLGRCLWVRQLLS